MHPPFWGADVEVVNPAESTRSYSSVWDNNAVGSKHARSLLDNWAEALPRFFKVMPRDYARALRQLEAERADAASVAAE